MLDFFSPPDNQCLNTSARQAYLYDGVGEAPAVLSETPLQGCPVVVENPSGNMYVFRPVDKAVYGPTDHKRGDVLLHTVDRLQLIFVEIKLWRMRGGWFKSGVEQLRSVVLDFIAAHHAECEASHVRRAYVCNPYHSRFAYSYAEEIRDFHRATRFALFPEGQVTFVKLRKV